MQQPTIDDNNNINIFPNQNKYAQESSNNLSTTEPISALSESFPYWYSLPYGTPDFNFFQNQFYQSLGIQYMNVISITRIDAIYNPILHSSYKRKKEELGMNSKDVEEHFFFRSGAIEQFKRDLVARFNFIPTYEQSSAVSKRPGVLFTKKVRDSLCKTKHIVYMVKVLESKPYLDSGLPIPLNVDTIYDLSGRYVLKFNSDEYYPMCAIFYNINEHDF